ncbi:MAG: PAS domain S-box protein, partial [Bacteroidetes bacterium]|nr:PAS domain S-box protein [Bacteroidota bacterium]
MQLCTCLLDPDTGKISNANQAAADYYGYPLEVLKQMNMSEINTMPAEKIQENMRITRRNRRGSFEFRHKLADGRIRDVAVMVNLMELKKKDYLYCIVYDITERKELFGEIIRAKEKAEESDRLKSAFLANMSHEIRTPLNGILGFTGLLTEKKILSDEKRDSYSKIIHRSAESLMQIIDDILDLSRLDTHQLSLVEKTFNLGESLSGIYLLYLKKLEENCKTKITLNLISPEKEILLNADENRLNQIWINLLDNAIKFTGEGTVSFGVQEILADRIIFKVSDTGIGIDKSKHQRIFDRFGQAGEEISQNYGGTGLGLSIVKKLLQLMGGDIRVESETGRGATFIFHLPFENKGNMKSAPESENTNISF